MARLTEAEEILTKYRAEVMRWDTEVKRLDARSASEVIDRRMLVESTNELKSSIAGAGQGDGDHPAGEGGAALCPGRAEKAQVDVRVAEADLDVAESEERYAKAWVDYLTLTAPFDGVITARNANTYDFVLPTTGDPTAILPSPDIAPSGAVADLRG